MKFVSLAIIALVGEAMAVQLRYDEAEGPTKADNGESDETVVPRYSKKELKKLGWVHPHQRLDDGNDDDTVLTMMNGQMLKITKRRIYDADGDGVEDNVDKTRDELDRFYHPFAFGVAEEINNTHHGNLPGHVRKEEEEQEPVYNDPWGNADFSSLADLHLHI